MTTLIVLAANGDSITGCTSSGICYPYQYLNITGIGDCTMASAQAQVNYVPPNFFMVHKNLAVAGSHLVDQSSVAGTYVDPMVQKGSAQGISVSTGTTPIPPRRYIYSLLTGTNDGCVASGSVATFVANVVAHMAARKAAGWDRVILGTVLPDGGMSPNLTEPNRATYNNTITGPNWAINNGIDAIFDLASDPIMGLFATTSNATYYSDGTHPTTVGHARLAPIWGATLTNMVNSLK